MSQDKPIDLKFEKGKYKKPSLEDLFGETMKKKEPKSEIERIEAGLTLRKKMADLCKAMSNRLGKSLDQEALDAMEKQIRQLGEMFEEYKELDVPL